MDRNTELNLLLAATTNPDLIKTLLKLKECKPQQYRIVCANNMGLPSKLCQKTQ